MKKLMVVTALLLVSALGLGGCAPRMFGALAAGAIVGAAVVGTAVAVEHAHYHYHNCGCPRHWDHGRWVYAYQGSYEYYDPYARVWYRY